MTTSGRQYAAGVATAEWRPVEGYPNYEVSSDGQVRSLPRERTRGGLLRQGKNLKGYWYVTLCRGRETHRFRTHRLVAEAFIGPCPAGQEVRHLDDDKDNNDAANLAYGTHAENGADQVRNQIRHRPRLGVQRDERVSRRRTHCRRDHPLTPENVYVGPDGKRRCRTCGNDRFRRRDERRRQEKGRGA